MSEEGAGEQSLRARLAALSAEQRATLGEKIRAAQEVAPTRDEPALADASAGFPMTDVQQAYWAGRSTDFELGGVATHAYHEIDATDLDVERLGRAWNRLVERHEMLRAVLLPDGKQYVLETVPRYEIVIDDLRNVPRNEIDGRLLAIRAAMSHQVLDADRWPIFEIRATRIDDQRTRVHLSFDAIIADLSSRSTLLREWRALYQNPDGELPPISRHFREFASADAVARESADYKKARDYWLTRVDALPPRPMLPLREGRISRTPPHFSRRSHRFDATRFAALERLARGWGVSLNILLLTAYADTLRLWSASSAFTLNLTLFNRPDAAWQSVVGDFTSLSLLEVGAPQEQNLAARAQRLQAQLWQDLDHRAFGGVAVLREIARRQGGAAGAAMPVVFTSLLSNLDAGGPRFEWLGQEVFSVSQTPQVWIDLMAMRADDALMIHWNAVDALFPPGLMDEMFCAYVRLLEMLASGALDGRSAWSAVAASLLPAKARRAQDAANATAVATTPRLLHDGWQRHADQKPDHPAVIVADRCISYGQLQRAVTDLAWRLHEGGVAPGKLVAVMIRKGWEQVVAVLAILEAGGAYLPIDPDLPEARLRGLLTDGDVRIVVTQPALAGRLSASVQHDLRILPIAEADLDAPVRCPLDIAPSPSGLAYVIYTSGSTGKPKGVAIEHAAAANTIDDINARFALGPEDRVLGLSALNFDLSVYDIFGTLAAGATLILPDHDALRDPGHWADLMTRHNVTMWNSVPALMELLTDFCESRQRLNDLRLVLLSGDRIAMSLPDAVRRIAPNARTIALGGATEASIWSIWHDTDVKLADIATVPYGKPLRNQRLHVRSSEGAACPLWVPGNIEIGGMGLAREYWRNAEASGAAFFVDPTSGDRVYRTGDRGRCLPDGSIEFLGREDGQVKLRGFRVELGEIEATLNAHPEVREAVVSAIGAQSSERQLIGHVVLEGASGLTEAALTAHLAELLPGYMVPARIVILPEMPLTPNGKVDRQHLSTHLPPQQVALDDLPDQASGRTPDRNDVEWIAALVKSLCGVAAPDARSSLLDLGLTSVDMIRILNAVDVERGVRLRIDDFYAAPTIHWLATQWHIAPRADAAERTYRDASIADSFSVALPPAVLPEALAALLQGRQTIRRFSLRPVAVEHLAMLLLAVGDVEGRAAHASATGQGWLRFYLLAKAGRIAGLAGGLYRLDRDRASLDWVSGDADLQAGAFRSNNALVVDEAAFAVFLVGDLTALEPRYGTRASHLATIEAGLATQNLELAAPQCGLGLCQIGSIDEHHARQLLALAPDEQLLHIIVGGYGDASPLATMAPEADEERRVARLVERVASLSVDDARMLLRALADDGDRQ
ncbi:MAG: amino acid adenylation domain-containing protein [Sphingomonas sp.]